MESSTTFVPSSPTHAVPAGPDAVSLHRLSSHLEHLLLDPAFPNRAGADTEIVLSARAGEPGGAAVVAAHSCILAARSSLFFRHFSSLPPPAAPGEKTRLDLADLVPGGRHIGRDALVAVLGYLYTGRLIPPPPQECMDEECAHGACRPAVHFIVECMYTASGFQIPELVSLYQRGLHAIVDKAFDEDIIPIIHLASKCQLSDLLSQCIRRVAVSTLDSKYLEKELPSNICSNIKEFGRCLFNDELGASIVNPEKEKTITNIYKALDSADVHLAFRLLNEHAITWDDAFPIHYAAAYCEPKVLNEMLKLDCANVNQKNKGGYTPLHMACMRLQPDIILALLESGASVLETTIDNRDPLTICKRLTRQQKYITRESKKGQETSNPYLCINILEQTKSKMTLPLYQVSLEETIVRATPLLVDKFIMMLLDLEYRVKFAKMFFPSEAQLAMRRAEVDSTVDFAATGLKEIDLNETPTMPTRLHERFNALTKTVEIGRRYFPNCSCVLDNFLDGASTLTIPGSGTPEDQLKMRFYKLREDFQKAFNKDKVAGAAKVLKASSSSSPRLEMLVLDTSLSQAVETDSTDAPAPSSGPSSQGYNAGTISGQIKLQSADVAVDDDVGVGSKRKLKSRVWNEFKRVKKGDDWFGICMWCCKPLTANTNGGTNHLRRHLNTCQSKQATKGLNQFTLKSSQNPEDRTITLEENVFDQQGARKELALMICIHEYPLSIVEHSGFRKFCAAIQPKFNVVSRNTISKDILDIYEVQKPCMVKHFQQCQARVAVTMDMWMTDQLKKSYMAITAHYIDDNWKLKSYPLRFIYVPEPHTGEVISDVLHEVLMEWHIETKLSTVTLDNCTASDNLMEKMVHKLPPNSLILDGSLLHMRYVAHTMNLIVQDGINLLDDRIERIRESVAFWVATPTRHKKFEEVASQRNIKYQNKIARDCKTRWDSTYAMLSTALDYKEVFICLAKCEKLFTPSCPVSADWKFARELCDRLKMFFDITELLSGTTYVTANLFFPKICGIYLALRKWRASKDPMIEKMSKLVKEKFEKYWLDVHNLMAVTTVLDPRYKLHLLNAIFIKVYGEEGASVKVAEVSKLLSNLVSHYQNSMDCVARTCGAPSTSVVQNQGNDEVFDLFDQLIVSLQPGVNSYVHTELDLYLKEPMLPRTQELDIINWWQFEGTKYPTLRKIARDILAISVTTVPSATVFGTGERIIGPHHSGLAPQILEALMCIQAWSRADMLGPDSTSISPLMTGLEEEKEMEDAAESR